MLLFCVEAAECWDHSILKYQSASCMASALITLTRCLAATCVGSPPQGYYFDTTRWSTLRTAQPSRFVCLPLLVAWTQACVAALQTSMSAGFAQAYLEALRDLNSTELNKIKLLRDLAKENPGQASNVVQALATHIFTCTPQQRLPALYVLDCILKSAGHTYPALLASVVQQVFAFVWDGATLDLRGKLAKTAGTWKDHLPPAIMAAILAKMQPLATPPWPQQSILLPGLGGGAPPVIFNAAGQPVMLAAMPGGQVQPMSFASGQGAVLQASMLPQQSMYGGVLLPSAPAGLSQPVVPSNVSPQGPVVAALPGQLQGVIPSATASALANSLLGLTHPSQKAASPVLLPVTASPGHAGSDVTQDPVRSAVDSLFQESMKTKQKFLDLQYVRNKRLQTATHQVRHWYVSEKQWLEGTRPMEDTPTPFAEQGDAAEGLGKEPAPAFVEADPSQPTCAISGETFDRTYDPNTDKWYYEDAVVLTGEQAAAYGVMEGSIVKVHCLAGAPLTSSVQAVAEQGRSADTPMVGLQGTAAAASQHCRKRAANDSDDIVTPPAVDSSATLPASCAAAGQAAAAPCQQPPEAKRIKAG